MNRARCTRFLSYGYDRTPKQTLEALAAYTDPDETADDFGRGGPLDRLERRLCDVLGTQAALFFPSGRTAQLVALRIWTGRTGNPCVAMHPQCHLEDLEAKAYSHVFNLRPVPVGRKDSVLEPADLDALAEPVGVATFEIPHLNLGCLLPPWEDLVAMSNRVRGRGIPLHADAARLWEIQPYYARPHREIAALFDSLYVSFYKGFSAMTGGALCGTADLIAEARIWSHRLGGNPRQMFPLALDALRSMERELPRMPDYHARAVSLASAFAGIPGVFVTPSPPQSNTFRVAFAGTPQALRRHAEAIAADTGVWLVDHMPNSPLQGLAMFQVVVGEAAMDIPVDEARDLVARLAKATSA